MKWSWYGANITQIMELTWAHVWLSVPAILAAILIAVPLGLVANRWKWSRGIIGSATGLLYALPSLAVFVMLPVILGTSILSPLNVQIALALYGIALMTRFAVDGFGAVPASAKAAAVAMGYSSARRLAAVEMPLAGPVLLAGARVVSASTVSLASVGSLIGVHGLGYFFTDGFNRSFPTEIFAGIAGTALVALVFDVALVLLGSFLMPWNRSKVRA